MDWTRLMTPRALGDARGRIRCLQSCDSCRCARCYCLRDRIEENCESCLKLGHECVVSEGTMKVLDAAASAHNYMLVYQIPIVYPDSDDPDSDDEVSIADPDPLQGVAPSMLAELSHLDLSEQVVFKENRFVGGGAYGDIFKGNCTFADRRKLHVALKRLRFHLMEDITVLFEKEIHVWSKLKHVNILPLLGYTFDSTTGYPRLVSEWMNKGSAWSYVTSNPDRNPMRLILGIARGLAYLHENDMVPSDIKSDNVLVSNSGDARICDFGCSRMIAASRSLANLSTGIKGTSRYLAYELLALPQPGDSVRHTKETDVWAFGMTVYELLSRKRPYGLLLPEGQVIVIITSHELPSLPPPSDPQASDRLVVRDILWDVCQLCWIHDPAGRADMASILSTVDDKTTAQGFHILKIFFYARKN